MSNYRFDPTDGSIKDEDGDTIVSPPDCWGECGLYKDSQVPGEPSQGVDVPFSLLVKYTNHHSPTEAEKEAKKSDLHLRMLYIGAVSLLCRVYRAGDVEDDDSVERLAKDFNAQGYGVEMAKAGGRSGWGIFERRNLTGDGG